MELGGEKLATIFKAEISFGLLGDILSCLNSEFKVEDTNAITSILEVLTKAGRFDLSLTFLSSHEKDTAEKLFDKLSETVKCSATNEPEENTESDKEISIEKLTLLKEKYKIQS